MLKLLASSLLGTHARSESRQHLFRLFSSVSYVLICLTYLYPLPTSLLPHIAPGSADTRLFLSSSDQRVSSPIPVLFPGWVCWLPGIYLGALCLSFFPQPQALYRVACVLQEPMTAPRAANRPASSSRGVPGGCYCPPVKNNHY